MLHLLTKTTRLAHTRHPASVCPSKVGDSAAWPALSAGGEGAGREQQAVVGTLRRDSPGMSCHSSECADPETGPPAWLGELRGTREREGSEEALQQNTGSSP